MGANARATCVPQACFTTRSAGDFGPPPPGASAKEFARHRALYTTIVQHRVSWLRQVHGAGVVTVSSPGQHCGVTADAAVTDQPGCAIGVVTADCAPVVLLSTTSVIGVAHAGWRGLLAGVLEQTIATMRELGARDIRAIIGPCIHPECYEFGAKELDAVVRRYGAAAAAATRGGLPALDLPTAVRNALDAAEVACADPSWCTACEPNLSFSFRARHDAGRQAAVVWLDPTDER